MTATTTQAAPAATQAAAQAAPQGIKINGVVFTNDHPLVSSLNAARAVGISETLMAVEALEKEADRLNAVDAALKTAGKVIDEAAQAAAAPQTAQAAAAPAAETEAKKDEAKKDEAKKTFPWLKTLGIVGGAVVVGGAGYFAYTKLAAKKASGAGTPDTDKLPSDMSALEVGYTPTHVASV